MYVTKVNESMGLTSDLFTNLTKWQILQLEGLTEAGVKCLVQNWAQLLSEPLQEPFCSAYWDGETCWPATTAGDNVTRSCSQVIDKGNENFQFQVKLCSENGTWTESNSSCLSTLNTSMGIWSTKEVIQYVLFLASVLSLLFLVMALFIFCYFKSIRCDRITVHIQFMLALALKSTALVVISEPKLLGEKYYYRSYGWSCKLVIIAHLYSYLASILWMLIQGHFLHSKLTNNIFKQAFHIKCYRCFGWGIPLILISFWFAAMETYHINSNHNCWKGYSKTPFIWIVGAPVLMALFINVLFLFNIMRILLKKIQLTSNATESQQIRRASKATAVLFPLLGINNLIFFVNPGGSGEAYYMMTNAILQPLQGIIVSVLYCFVCNDVKLAIKREWKRFSARKSLIVSRSISR
ncbi:unnamed protein product [Allacma fusca]|uniref:Uncharacterized protein n=1 Tax=Allacma fusca TaxID=39272 RepID=A0A8J2K6K3_9HEXA|nr:unnamed protein product [Allacma fusca]